MSGFPITALTSGQGLSALSGLGALGNVTGTAATSGSALGNLSGISATSGSTASSSGNVSFSGMVSQALQGVSSSLNQADQLASSFAVGGNVSIDQLMLAEQQASLAVDTVAQVQQKVVQSYQQLMNMQI